MLRRAALPDPDSLNASDVVIYDGECNFCRSQVGYLSRLDRRGDRLSFLSLHDPRVANRYADLSHEDLMKQIYLVDQSGTRHGGADAIRYLSRRLPMLWPVAPMLHIPGTARLWRWMYHQIAKRRYQLAGRTCDNDSCGIHFD